MNKLKGRIVVNETICYQQPEEQPTPFSNVFSRWVDKDEQAYIRRSNIGEEWQEIDTGWIIIPGMLIIHNDGVGRFLVNPTPEQKKDAEAKVLEVGTMIPSQSGASVYSFGIVRPKESCRFEPLSQIFIRCRNGETKVNIAVLPV